MTFPSRDIVAGLPKLENGKPDPSFLPVETVKNVLLNCLANYTTRDRKDIFFIQTIASVLVRADEETVELKDKLTKFLIEVVYDMTVRKEKDEQVGLYFSWVTAQVLEELGVINNED